ncbi:hypothetical protein OEB99_07325 [Actinotalea sp. M2MS4P-6]|uniref:hypothetical protein n=1 Tax=Actinotalea sp. M2MS4P-6 TaxID=2983762 RepID=UPI0021E4EBF6|nr:hypothetical protein [Actinotalea sp. M2MS4P-6]MCV2394112.1 hypothetical protein [Actinotalea sp. M2MS4P-6]
MVAAHEPHSPGEPASGSAAERRTRRPSPAARRFGYVVAIAVNLVMLGLIVVWPGWQAVPFLTEATTEVLPAVEAQLWTSIAVNVVWILADPRWLRALGETVTSAVGLAAAVRILTVFPFAFEDGTSWATLARFVLWIAVVGSAIGVLVNAGRVIRALVTGPVESPGA